MRKILAFVFIISQLAVVAQKKELTLKDAIIGRYTNLRTETLPGLSWQNNNTFTYFKNDTLWLKKVGSDDLSSISLAEINKIIGLKGDKKLKYINYSWQNSNRLLIKHKNVYRFINVSKKSIDYEIAMPDTAENVVYNDAGKYIAYTIDNNLYLKKKTGETVTVTDDCSKEIVNAQTAHRNEFGFYKGIFDSPKGNYIAYYRKDESKVVNYPLVDYMTRSAKENLVKYPMAGMDSEETSLVIYNIKTGEKVEIQPQGTKDSYLTNIAWSPDEQSVYVLELNREQNHLFFNQYNVKSGKKVKTLFEETDERYVEPLSPIQFSKKNSNQFYYLSRKNGWFHLYKYNVNGKQLQQITNGNWEVLRVVGFDKEERHVFIVATKESPVEQHIYKVRLKDGSITKLSSDEGVHDAILSADGNNLIDIWRAPQMPYQVDVINTKNGKSIQYFQAKNPLEAYNLGANKLIELHGENGAPNLYSRLILPPNFDMSKKYPVIVYVYGGPHSQLVNKSFLNAARMWQYYMASKGYIAYTLDNRGTLNRGRDFETAIHRNLGVLETEDQMRGVAFLKSLPFVDSKRIGVHGWSYGGFMTLNLMMRHPETFKVGVAGGPVVDWSMYEVMYGERYMDMPKENPKGYKEANMVNHIDSLQGKLLIIHGAQDKTVVMQHSMKFLRESVKKNKQVDFFVYPIHPHNVRGYDRIHLMQKVSNYFFDYL